MKNYNTLPEFACYLVNASTDPYFMQAPKEHRDKLEAFCEANGYEWVPVYCEEYPEDIAQGMGLCAVSGLTGWCMEIETA